jgi:VCBS repeat-containing protein
MGYLFDAVTGNLLQPFFNPDANWDDEFGAGVALVGENVLIGTPRDQTAGFRKGIAYLFHGPTGRLLSTVENPSPQTTSQFGFSVAALGKDLVIGSLPAGSGAVFLIRGDCDPITTVTDADGNYEFTGVPPGVYAVAEVLPATFRQTSPGGPCTYTANMVAEERIAGLDFGNWQPPAIVARSVFYNDSVWDGNSPLADTSDVQAIAPDKNALLPGETAAWANYTSYSRGINGIILDIAGLADAEHLSAADDFELKFGNDDHPEGWSTVAALPTVDVRPGEGSGLSDRVTLIWEDNAIPTRNWLQVRVKATAATGLEQDEVFYFGNAIGDVDGNGWADQADMQAISEQVPQPTALDSPLDIDRDGAVAYADMYAAYLQRGQLPPLNMITVPSVVATDDAAATDEDATELISVLRNDRDADGTPRSVAAADATSALGASVTVNPDGTLTYDPRGSAALQALAAGEALEDTFAYTIRDVRGGADIGTVTVTVSGADEPLGPASGSAGGTEATGLGSGGVWPVALAVNFGAAGGAASVTDGPPDGGGLGTAIGGALAAGGHDQGSGSAASPGPAVRLPDRALLSYWDAWRQVPVAEENPPAARPWRRPGLLDDGPVPLPKKFDAAPPASGYPAGGYPASGYSAARTTRTSAYDAVIEHTADSEGPETRLGRWDWLWGYDFEQMRITKRSSGKDQQAEQATDELLAAWPGVSLVFQAE